MSDKKTIPELQKELEEIEKLIEREKPISYRKSRQILRRGLMENIAAKWFSGQSAGEAIKSGVSDEMKALAKKFKEATSPLGIAKALTGGSAIGPLIVGKILGSDIRDVEYFSGMRLRHRSDIDDEPIEDNSNPLFVGKQQAKITNVKVNESVSNAMGQLYTLYKKTYEQEKKMREMQQDFAKEQESEENRKHAEVLSALEELKNKAGNIKIPVMEQPSEQQDLMSKLPGKTGARKRRPLTKTRLKAFFRKNKVAIAATAAAGAAGMATSLLSRNTTATQINTIKSKEIYEYLTKEKKLDHNNAVGILANIQAESSFNSAAIGDNGTSGGLFQHHAGRFDALQKAVPDWQTNWKGQIDFALSEKDASGYQNLKFNSPQQAADWWVRNFERPRDLFGESQKRMAYSELFDKAMVANPLPPNATGGQQISQMTVENTTLKKDMQQSKSPVVVNNNNTVVTKLPNKSHAIEVSKSPMDISYESPFMWIQRGYS